MPKEQERVTTQARYDFSREEKLALGTLLARENQTIFDLRRKKREIGAALAADIMHAETRVADLMDRLNQGYEMREALCVVVLNSPSRGRKSILRADTGETVREEAMTFEELQQPLPFEGTKEDDESQPFKRKKDVN